MKSILIAAAALLSLSSAANAATVIQGTATASVHSSDPGLVLTSTPGLFDVSLALDGSAPSSANVSSFFTVGTAEGSVELFEDTVHYPISVLFNFANPFDAAGSPITGQSFGYYKLFSSCGLIFGGCGAITWDGAQVFSFGQGGTFSIALNNVSFGTPGTANVGGTITLLTPSVPEPATWAMMLLGFGAVGFAMRRTRPRTAGLLQQA